MIWRELRFTVSPDCDFRVLEKQLLEVVEAVFARYRDSAQSQLLAMQRNLNVRIDSTRPQSRVRLGAAGLEITLRYPVDARNEVQVARDFPPPARLAGARNPPALRSDGGAKHSVGDCGARRRAARRVGRGRATGAWPCFP